MPIHYLRGLTGKHRSPEGNLRLARFLAFNAGAVNAGGFLAVGQYTSHMSGIVASISDNLVLGQLQLAFGALAALFFFIAGAASSAVLIHWGRRHTHHSEYALPLLAEALLLLLFGLIGGNLAGREWLFVPVTVALLCFVMGLQNAMITKLSKAEIRTTHVTGMVTDIGIELGKLLYWNRTARADADRVVADRRKLWVWGPMVGLFFLGGLAGAYGFKYLGFVSTLPLAALLVGLAAVPLLDELQARWRGPGPGSPGTAPPP